LKNKTRNKKFDFSAFWNAALFATLS